MSIFKVVSRVWHTKENKFYEPGETVDLSHLDGIGLAAVLNSGAVMPVATVEKAKETPAPTPPKEGE